MPTGYTAAIEDGDDLNARNFVKRCARAFGAFAHQRDEGIDSPPRPPEGGSDYYAKALVRAQQELQDLTALSPEGIEARWREHVQQIEKSNAESIERYKTIKERYDSVRVKVEAWQPNEEAQPIKDYCLDQIKISTEFMGPYLSDPAPSPEAWYESAVSLAKRDVEYYAKQMADEKKRLDERYIYALKALASIAEVEE